MNGTAIAMGAMGVSQMTVNHLIVVDLGRVTRGRRSVRVGEMGFDVVVRYAWSVIGACVGVGDMRIVPYAWRVTVGGTRVVPYTRCVGVGNMRIVLCAIGMIFVSVSNNQYPKVSSCYFDIFKILNLS